MKLPYQGEGEWKGQVKWKIGEVQEKGVEM